MKRRDPAASTDIRRLEALARHSRLSIKKAASVLGISRDNLEAVLNRTARFIPWVDVDRTSDGVQIRIDWELRLICEGLRPRPSLGGISLLAFYSELRLGIKEQREAANDKRNKRNWNPEEVFTAQQHKLLDWIEDELDRVASVIDYAKAPNGSGGSQPHSGNGESHNELQKSIGGRDATDF